MDDIFVHSFIDIDKWNSAKWYATAFVHDAEGVDPPYMGLVFQNIAAGREIFADWLERLGKVDQYEELRIAVIEGEILGEEPGYSVHISSDLAHTEERARANGTRLDFRTAFLISRHNRMTPAAGSPHLPRFKELYQRHGRYRLIPVSDRMEPLFEFAIEKKQIHLRQACEVTAHDMDSVVFPKHYFDHDGTIH